MISVPLSHFDTPRRLGPPRAATDCAPAVEQELLHARDVAGLIHLIIVIQRAAVDANGWEEVGRLFAALCESFSGESVAALRAVRGWITDDRERTDAHQTAISHLPLPRNESDAADALRDIVAPAIDEAVRNGTSRESAAAMEARLDLCLDHCAQGMMTFAADGRCLFLNRAAARLLKLPVDPERGFLDGRILPRPLRKVVDDFTSTSNPQPEWLPCQLIEISSQRVQCFPLVGRKAGARAAEALLHLFLVPEPRAESLADRLLVRAHLSKQETFVARAVLDGKSNTAIAREMKLSVHTIRTYVERIYEKLDVANRYELMKLVSSMTDYPTVVDNAR